MNDQCPHKTPVPPPPTARRFNGRAELYERWRPGYPAELLPFLRQTIGLAPEWIVADVGSGTGIFTRMLLEAGHIAYAVEPNEEMRAIAERTLGGYPSFRSVAGSAEAVPLPNASVHCVTAAQAGHWFHPQEARREFSRILRPGGWVILVWNRRLSDASDFMREYDEILRRCCLDYDRIERRQEESLDSAAAFFSPGVAAEAQFANRQVLDFEGLLGRTLSCSYAPLPGDANYAFMEKALRDLHARRERAGHVAIHYRTRLCYGRLPRGD